MTYICRGCGDQFEDFDTAAKHVGDHKVRELLKEEEDDA